MNTIHRISLAIVSTCLCLSGCSKSEATPDAGTTTTATDPAEAPKSGAVAVSDGGVKAGSAEVNKDGVKTGNTEINKDGVKTGNVEVKKTGVKAGGVEVKDGKVVVPGVGTVNTK